MPYNEKQKEYSLRYAKEKLKRVPLDLRIEEYETLKRYTERTGESINGFIRRIIKESIEGVEPNGKGQ